ncbi:MAG: sigma 54 modulation/S30EA ribosomal C-terminal domain-containing protein [Candidatus Dojkabacteria bacterium]
MKNNQKIQTKFVNTTYSPTVSQYISKKLQKKPSLSKDIISMYCNVVKDSEKSGKTYKISLTVEAANTGFIVKEKGADLYKLVDIIADKFYYRLGKIVDKRTDTKKTTGTGSEYAATPEASILPESEERSVTEAYYDSITGNSIVERRSFYDNTPLHVPEAIQILEMTGKECLLFKNVSNGRYSVLYRVQREEGISGYGLLEHKIK